MDGCWIAIVVVAVVAYFVGYFDRARREP